MVSELSWKLRFKAPKLGRCGPTAIPIRIKKGTTENLNLAASSAAAAIRTRAVPTSRTR
jgi:hypothetical protein